MVANLSPGLRQRRDRPLATVHRYRGGSMELTGTWRAAVADDDLRRTWHEDDFDDDGWEAVDGPRALAVGAPAFADADGPLLYRRSFDAMGPAEGRRAWLTFDGIFYQGDVWLDGGYLGDTEGYFAPHTFEVTDALRARGEHHLAVEVTCTPPTDLTAKRNITGVFQHWDCLDPDWNPGGVWRPVRVTETGPVRIARLRALCREATAERAVAGAAGHARQRRRAHGQPAHARSVALDHAADQPLAAGANEVEWTLTVERPGPVVATRPRRPDPPRPARAGAPRPPTREAPCPTSAGCAPACARCGCGRGSPASTASGSS